MRAHVHHPRNRPSSFEPTPHLNFGALFDSVLINVSPNIFSHLEKTLFLDFIVDRTSNVSPFWPFIFLMNIWCMNSRACYFFGTILGWEFKLRFKIRDFSWNCFFLCDKEGYCISYNKKFPGIIIYYNYRKKLHFHLNRILLWYPRILKILFWAYNNVLSAYIAFSSSSNNLRSNSTPKALLTHLYNITCLLVQAISQPFAAFE